MLKIIRLILKYLIKEYLPALGLIFILGAGNIPTLIMGITITIISLYNYLEENLGDTNVKD